MTMLARGREAFLLACRLDVQVRKPGNVSLASAGHGMVPAQFIAAAEAAAHGHDDPRRGLQGEADDAR